MLQGAVHMGNFRRYKVLSVALLGHRFALIIRVGLAYGPFFSSALSLLVWQLVIADSKEDVMTR
jgi:hypothetical protein